MKVIFLKIKLLIESLQKNPHTLRKLVDYITIMPKENEENTKKKFKSKNKQLIFDKQIIHFKIF